MLSDNIRIDGVAFLMAEDDGQKVLDATWSSEILFDSKLWYKMALSAMTRASDTRSPCIWGSGPFPECLNLYIFFRVGLAHCRAQGMWLGIQHSEKGRNEGNNLILLFGRI